MIHGLPGWSWAALALLGAYHGINPGMGWLLAVGRGMEQRSRRAVVSALLPIAIGHELSVFAVVGAVLLTAHFVPSYWVRLGAGLLLVLFGAYKLIKPRSHPRGGGMRMNNWQVGSWSFLMASGHGAGLMLAPVLLGLPVATAYPDLRQLGVDAVLLSGLHVTVMLATMGVVALVVYERVGLAVLRRAWLNLDLAWAGILLLSGGVALAT